MTSQVKELSLKSAAKARGFGLYKLSEVCDISISQLYLIERNPLVNVGIVVIEKIYKATGIRPSEYLKRDVKW